MTTKFEKIPVTHMTSEQVERFCLMLQGIPADIGWSISHQVRIPHTPEFINNIHVVLRLPGVGGENVEAHGDTPYEAMALALQKAHEKAAETFAFVAKQAKERGW